MGTVDSDIAINVTLGEQASIFFPGDMDDMRLWSDIRTQTEVDDHAFKEVELGSNGLVMYVKFNESSGTAIEDSTGITADGTATAVTFKSAGIWYGYLNDIVPVPSQRGRKLAMLEAFGALAQFTEENVELPMATNIASGDVFDDILDELGWPAADRDVDTGKSTFARFWSKSISALKLMRSVVKSENGFIVEDRNGDIRFEDRHRRLLAPHTVSQATFDDAAASTLKYHNPVQQNPRLFIRNSFTVDIRQYTVGSLAVLWTLPETAANSPMLAPGEFRDFKAIYPVADSPSEDVGVDAWTTLVDSTDYEANTQSGGGGTDVSSDIGVTLVVKRGNSMSFRLTNNGAVSAFITLLQARGTPVAQSDPIPMISEDAASIVLFKKRSFDLSEHFLSSSQDGQDWCDYNVAIFATEIPIIDVELLGNTSLVHMEASKLLDISDRVTFKGLTQATQLGLNEDFFIETIAASMGEDQLLHTKYTLTPASGYSGFWILGTSELDTGTVPAF